MRKFTFWSILFLLLAALLTLSVLLGSRQLDSFTVSAEEFIDQSITPVLFTWNIESFQQMLTTSLRVSSDTAELHQLLLKFHDRLGPLAEIKGRQLNVHSKHVTGITFRIVAEFTLETKFTNGPGSVTGSLEYEGDHWAISEFFVISSLLED